MHLRLGEWSRRTYPAPLGAGGVGSIPANSDAQNVPSFRRWRFEMKLSPCDWASEPYSNIALGRANRGRARQLRAHPPCNCTAVRSAVRGHVFVGPWHGNLDPSGGHRRRADSEVMDGGGAKTSAVENSLSRGAGSPFENLGPRLALTPSQPGI